MKKVVVVGGLVLMMVLLIAGCSGNEIPKETTGTSSLPASTGEEVNKEILAAKVDITEPVEEETARSIAKEKKESLKKPAPKQKQADEGLVIQSDNQVMAGSKQQVVEELEKATDELLKSLENMDSVNKKY